MKLREEHDENLIGTLSIDARFVSTNGWIEEHDEQKDICFAYCSAKHFLIVSQDFILICIKHCLVLLFALPGRGHLCIAPHVHVHVNAHAHLCVFRPLVWRRLLSRLPLAQFAGPFNGLYR
jgi:hypothetical protein